MYATAPQDKLLWRRSGKGITSTVICTATLAAGLVGLVGLTQVADGTMRLYCGALAFMGLLMSGWVYRASHGE